MNSRAKHGTQLIDSARFRIAALTICHVSGTVQSVSVWSMAPLIRADLELSAGQFGWFVSAYYGAQMICAFPAGALADRIGVGRSMIVAMLILACGAAALSTVNSMSLALLALATMGTGYAIVNPASARGVLNWIPADFRATAMGVKQTGVPLGGVLAALSGVLAVWFGWRVMMLVTAACALATIMLLLPLLKIPRRSGSHGPLLPWRELQRVFADTNVRVFANANALLQIGQGNFFAYLTLFLRDVGQTSQSFASLCLGLAQLTSTAGRIGWGVLCDRLFQQRRTTLVIIISTIAAVGLCAMALITPANVTVLALLLSAILGLTIASFAGLTLTIASEASPPERAATTVGMNLMMVSFGGVVGPPLFGYAMDYWGGYAAGWLITGVSVLAAVCLLRYVFVERGGREPV